MKERWLRGLGWVLLLALIVAGVRFWPRPPLAAWAPQSKAVLAADGSLLRLTLASDQQYRLWTPREEIAPVMVEAMLVQEDRWFHWHLGVNPVSLLRGATSTYLGGARQGGSTLTMQLARLMYRLDTRDPLGKLRQCAHALWLEARYSKAELLEAYLNLAPFGGNVEGVGAASLVYFGKPPARLTPAEALTLAVIPQHPSLRPANQESLAGARARLLERWRRHHSGPALADSDFALDMGERRLPFLAPHLVDQVIHAVAPGTPARTTLDPALQRLLERQLDDYLARLRPRGVRNATALLVDTRDMGVRALVGSAAYFDADIHGQVNGVIAKRSPGSTLKPFIYALALDQGIIHPRSMLKDAPSSFGPYAPENYDGRFVGPLSATDALNRSRNVPAVWLASRIREPDLYGLLKASGVSGLRAREHYGLALALGGGDLSAEELAMLYAMLANKGQAKPLRYFEDTPQRPGTPLLSPQAAWLTLDMLASRPRLDGSRGQRARHWFSAWKTGTSWGFRDAWTAGVVGPYVLVVWLGNFDGAGNPALVGIEAAAPLWQRIADALPLVRREPAPPPPMPPGVRQVEICSASGELPNAWCPRTEMAWFIPGRSPIKVSELHRPVWVDGEGRAVCPPYGPDARQEVYEFWSSDLAALFRRAGLPRRPPPAPPNCGATLPIVGGEPPRISSPMAGLSYSLRRSRTEESLALSAVVAGEAKTVFWFADEALLGHTAPGERLAWRPARAGRYLITATDDRGRSDSREVVVEVLP